MTARVFFYVQHLLGVGHVYRALRIAYGLRDAGFTVDLVMGGVPIAGIDASGFNVVQLQPLKAGSQGFGYLVTPLGEPAGADLKAARAAELLAAFAAARPDVLLIEAFPFGRRQVRFELLPLLKAAHARSRRPVIACSIRDILQERVKPERMRETIDTLKRYFDQVIVHGDPSLVTLAATFPLADEIAAMTSYSGLVAPKPKRNAEAGRTYDTVVSAGGGAVGRQLMGAAISAKARTSISDLRWLLVTGLNAGAADFAELARRAADAQITVERFVPDLPSVLTGARLSISQAGYNTVSDILVAQCRAVFIPFAAGGETEQSRRARLLEERGLCIAVAEQDLTADRLAEAIDRAMLLPPPAARLDLEGASRTAAILKSLLGRR